MKIPLLVIAGPTGVGKTASAVALAHRVPLEVVSADSRQVYRRMDVATGKPTAEERAAVAHHLVDVVDPDDRYHAERFARDARGIITAIRERGKLPVVVGGTGFYIRALLRGLDPAPPADPSFRRELDLLAAREGRRALHERLSREAPALARRLHPNDYVRVMRALELTRAGRSTPGARDDLWRRSRDYDVLHVGLTMERAELARRLRVRAAGMVEAGLLDEVRALLAAGYDPTLPAMQGIGYRQFVAVAPGELTPAEATPPLQRGNRRYAQRPSTLLARAPDGHRVGLVAARR